MEKKDKFVFLVATSYVGDITENCFGAYENPFEAFVACHKASAHYASGGSAYVLAFPLNKAINQSLVSENSYFYCTWNSSSPEKGEFDLDYLEDEEILKLTDEEFKKSCQYREFMKNVGKLLNSSNEENGEAE